MGKGFRQPVAGYIQNRVNGAAINKQLNLYLIHKQFACRPERVVLESSSCRENLDAMDQRDSANMEKRSTFVLATKKRSCYSAD